MNERFLRGIRGEAVKRFFVWKPSSFSREITREPTAVSLQPMVSFAEGGERLRMGGCLRDAYGRRHTPAVVTFGVSGTLKWPYEASREPFGHDYG